jgi:arylsulfatase A-like enzyme
LPTFILLGIALPITFAAWIDRYLYYLRPGELLPTYATAWLLLVALTVPFSGLAGLLLSIPERFKGIRQLHAITRFLLVWLAATAIAGALASGFMLWIRSFGVFTQFDPRQGLTLFTFGAGFLIALTRWGKAFLERQYSLAKWSTALGGLLLLSLPFTGWGALPPLQLSARTVSGADAAMKQSARPHILLVTVDTLSAQHMSLYGAARETTPNLDSFSRGATTFDRAYANGNFTTAGIASIMTGTRPWTSRALQLPGWPIGAVRPSSLPAFLREAGYQTAYVATNQWAAARRLGLGSYFDFAADRALTLSVCHDALVGWLRYDCVASELLPFRFAQMAADAVRAAFFDRPPNWQSDPRPAIEASLQWLRTADKGRPIFSWLHLMPPHSPYAAPAPWLGRYDASSDARRATDSDVPAAYLFSRVPKNHARVLEARYDEAITYVDHYLGQYLDEALRILGPNTVVIITADHGESFEHDYGMHTGPGLYDSIIRIPLLIKLPGQSTPLRSARVSEQVDIAPTLAALIGIVPPADWEGRSLLEAPSVQDASPAKPAFSMNFEQNRKRGQLTTGSVAVVDDRWKLVHYSGPLHYPLMPPLRDELYDLAADPAESKNLAAQFPQETQALLKMIGDQMVHHGNPLP